MLLIFNFFPFSLCKNYLDSRIGFSSFIDKPLGNFGDVADYCYRSHFPLVNIYESAQGNLLGQNSDTGDIVSFRSSIDNLVMGSGLDYKEDQLSALIHSTLTADWNDANGHAKLIVLATNSTFHEFGEDFNDDNLNIIELERSPTLDIYSADPSEWCSSTTYPSMADVYDTFLDKELNLLVLTEPHLVKEYQSLVDTTNPDRGFVVGIDAHTNPKVLVKSLSEGLQAAYDNGNFGSVASARYKKLIAMEEVMISNDSRVVSKAPLVVHDDIVSGNFDDAAIVQLLDSTPPLTSKDQVPRCGNQDVKFEVVIAQDASAGWNNMKDSISSQLAEGFERLLHAYPGSKVALESFVDKPLLPFGYGAGSANDYCATMRVGLTDNLDMFKESYDSLIIRSGNDEKEAQLHALVHPMLSERTQFSNNTIDEVRKI